MRSHTPRLLCAALAAGVLLAGCGSAPAWKPGPPISAELPPPREAPLTQPVAAAFLPDGFGALSVADCHAGACQGDLWVSGDFGGTWRPEATGTGEILGLQAVPGDALVAWTQHRVYMLRKGGALLPISPVSTGQQSLVAAFSDPLHGYIALRGGCELDVCAFDLLRTQDGGKAWEAVARNNVPGPWSAPRTANLPNGSLAFLAAPAGDQVVLSSSSLPGSALYVSDDGGRHFHAALFAQAMMSGAFAPGGVGWAVRGAGCAGGTCTDTLLRTTDGGNRWQAVRSIPEGGGLSLSVGFDGAPWLDETIRPQGDCDPCAGLVGPLPTKGSALPRTLPKGAAPLRVDAVTAKTAFVLGWQGGDYALWRTEDGAQHWQEVATFRRAAFPSLSFGFTSKRQGWALSTTPSGGSQLVETRDGGRTWLPEILLPGAAATSYGVSGHVAWMRAAGRTMRSTDGGRTWHRVTLPQGTLLDVGFAGRRRGYAVLSPLNGTPPSLYLTSDGGRLWRKAHGDVFMAALGKGGAVYALSRTPGRAVRLLRSDDSGRTWTSSPAPASKSAIHFGVAPDGTLFMQGMDFVRLSGDAGRRWHRLSFPKAQIAEVSFLSRRQWWVLTAQGLFDTADGGLTWHALGSAQALQGPGVP